MVKIKPDGCLWTVLLFFISLQMACAQNPHSQSAAILAEEKLVQNSTVLLNNDQQLLPLQNLDAAKIASVHF